MFDWCPVHFSIKSETSFSVAYIAVDTLSPIMLLYPGNGHTDYICGFGETCQFPDANQYELA